jgi:HAD superfamily hydrolase (TIGR01509 family)
MAVDSSLRPVLLWDVDGTLAETELDGHRRAFNRAFAEAGLPCHWDRSTYQELLAVSGGRERMAHYFTQTEGCAPTPERLEALQAAKQRHYQHLVAAGALQLRPGVARLLRQAAAAGWRQAIVTTSGRSAVTALLDRLLPDHPQLLQLWICGEDVTAKKPDPEAYRLALAQLNQPPEAAIAVEDSGPGLAAAAGAGVPVLVTRSSASQHEPQQLFAAAVAVVDQLGEPEQPCRWLLGRPCPLGHVTLSYLEQLLEQR